MSRDVKFIEDVFPFATLEDVHIESYGFELPYDIHDDFVEYEEYINNVVHDVHNGNSEDTTRVGDSATAFPLDEVASAQQHQPTNTGREAAVQPLGRGFREKVPSVLLRDYVTHSVFAKNSSPSTPSSNTPSGTPYPLAHYINCEVFCELL